MNAYDQFDKSQHVLPEFQRSKFEELSHWDFGWEILEPINIAEDQDESEKALAIRLSSGQKALYFFWYLDAQVTNGGFIQFYWNGYRKYLQPILSGLKLVGDVALIELLEKVDSEYLTHQRKFEQQLLIDDWEPLYEKLTNFDEYDDDYNKHHDLTMSIIERYIRKNPTEFVQLID